MGFVRNNACARNVFVILRPHVQSYNQSNHYLKKTKRHHNDHNGLAIFKLRKNKFCLKTLIRPAACFIRKSIAMEVYRLLVETLWKFRNLRFKRTLGNILCKLPHLTLKPPHLVPELPHLVTKPLHPTTEAKLCNILCFFCVFLCSFHERCGTFKGVFFQHLKSYV